MKARKLETMAPCVANKAESLCRELVVKRHVSSSKPTFQHGQLLVKILGVKGWEEYIPKNPSPLTVFIKQSPELLYTRPFPELKKRNITILSVTDTIVKLLTNLSVGWFITRALTTSAGVPIMAPTNLQRRVIVNPFTPGSQFI